MLGFTVMMKIKTLSMDSKDECQNVVMVKVSRVCVCVC